MTYGGTLFSAYYNAHRSRLPAGYREVEYLESTGAQWIDTGVLVDQDTDVAIEYRYTQYGNTYSAFGRNPLLAFTVNTQSQMMYRYNGSTYTGGIDVLIRAERRMQGNVVRENGDIVYSFPKTVFSSVYTALLFARRSGTGSVEEKSRMMLWRCSIGNSRLYIPCVRTADSKPGLYDLCGSICPLTGTPFYVNAGTGADFLWGELG